MHFNITPIHIIHYPDTKSTTSVRGTRDSNPKSSDSKSNALPHGEPAPLGDHGSGHIRTFYKNRKTATIFKIFFFLLNRSIDHQNENEVNECHWYKRNNEITENQKIRKSGRKNVKVRIEIC